MFYSAFKKDTEKVVIKLDVKVLLKIIEKFRDEKTFCMFVSPNIFLRGAWNINYKNNCTHEKRKAHFIQLYNLVQDHKVHIFSTWCMHAPKFSTRYTAL